MMSRSAKSVALLLFPAAVLLSACDSDSGPEVPVEPEATSELGKMGETIYRSTVDDGNSFTCATCHALTEPAADFRRPGHSIGDAAARPSYKNGQVSEMREAVNSCLTEWMNAEPWEASDDRWVALETFLEEIAPPTAEPLSFTVLAAPSESDLAGGNPDAGREVFNASCAVCHGENGDGTDQAPSLMVRPLGAEEIGRRVRTSGRADSSVYNGPTGGIMPFWAADRLSNEELRDMVAWLVESNNTAGDDDDDGPFGDDDDDDDDDDTGPVGDDDDDDDTGPSGNCGVTHPKIGQTAELSNLFHDVGGTAEIIDDCTVRITNFTYDATGIDVRLYGGLGGDYDNGFAMGEDLVRANPYLGETLDFPLPEGMTMDDLDGVSVWCVDVGIDFGSGTFN